MAARSGHGRRRHTPIMWRTGREWLAGAVLVVVGCLLLAERRMPEMVPLIPLVAGLLTLLWFLVRRSGGALLLGCVLTGAGVGVLLDREGSSVAGVALLACVAAGLVSGSVVLLVSRSGRLALAVALDLWTAAGLLRLALPPEWTNLAGAAAVIAIRRLVGAALTHTAVVPGVGTLRPPATGGGGQEHR